MQLTLHTITPVHVGNGEELYDLDYAVHNNVYYRIPQKTVLEFLRNIDKGPSRYAEWIEENTDEMNDLKQQLRQERDKRRRGDYNQQLNQIRSQFNVLNFAESINKRGDFIRHLQAASEVYKIPFNGRLTGQIRGSMKTGTGKPYIPGSSIKGAIRTALLYRFLSKGTHQQEIKRAVESGLDNARKNPRRQRSIIKTMADRLEHLAFYCHFKKGDRLKTNDEKYDLMKLLKVSDGHLSGSPESNMRLADVKLYLVSKVRSRHNRDMEIKATEQSQAPFVEAIKKNVPIAFNLDIDLNFLLQYQKYFADNQVVAGKGKQTQTHWIGIKDKVKQIFGLDIMSLTADNLSAKKTEVLNYVFESLKIFNQKQIAHQKDWLDYFVENDKGRRFDVEIGNGHEGLFANENQRLIHFGFGTGFTGITEYLHLFETPELKPLLKQMMEVFKIGDKPGADRMRRSGQYYQANTDRFPKSRRLVRDDRLIQPLGWGVILLPGEEADFNLVAGGEGNSTGTVNKIVTSDEPAKAEFFKGQLNPKKRPEMDAEVIHSGRPNKVRIYVSPDYMPEVQLDGYRNPLEKGKIVIVSVGVSKKKQITQVSFIKEKK